MSRFKSGNVWREFLMALRQRAFLLVGLAILAGSVTYGVVARLPEQHEVYYSYVVSLVEREQNEEFRFDGYYALQATDLFATTLAQWVAAPEVIASAYEEAGLELPKDLSGQQLTRSVQSEKTAPQLVQVTVKEKSPQKAMQLAAGLRRVMERRVAEYHEAGIPELEFRAVPTKEWSGVVATKDSLAALAAAGLVILIGVNFVAMQVTLKRDDADSDRWASAN